MPTSATDKAAITVLCRDCGETDQTGSRCRVCRSPRLLRHAELGRLAIAHIDCDAFYAAIEKRDDPSLIDKPVIIGGGRRGVVSTACYVARINGVKSAMPMFKALKACPDAVVIKPNMAKYAAVGREIRTLMQEMTPLVEPLSIDEAFLDLSGTERLHHHPAAVTLAAFARRIETEIGITVSVGLSFNKFLAKIASDQDKPRGFFVIGKAEATAFLGQQGVGRIWGVGKAMQRRLETDGFRMIADLQRADRDTLMRRYGSMGLRLYELSRAEDSRPVKTERAIKSISAETTFGEDHRDFEALTRSLWRLSEKVADRMKKKGLSGRTVTLKLKTPDFKLRTRQIGLDSPTQIADRIHRTAETLLHREATGTAFRLIGVGLSDLSWSEGEEHDTLFDRNAERRAQAERATDRLRARFGSDAVTRGLGFNPQAEAPRGDTTISVAGHDLEEFEG